MKYGFLLLTLLCSILPMHGQGSEPVILFTCYQQAITNYPVSKQKDILSSASELRLKNLTAAWFPQFAVSGQTTWQSDVTSIQLPAGNPIGEIPKAPQDQYKLTLDINQTLYDGGLTRKQKNLEGAGREADIAQVDVELYQLKDRINSIYFMLLMLKENERVTLSMKQTIDSKLTNMESAVRNGLQTRSNLEILQAEQIRLDQKLFEIHEDITTALEMLSELTGASYTADANFQLPDVHISDSATARRPEEVLYETQQKKLDMSGQMVNSRYLPRIMAFSQLGYGNPGLNMLNDKFDTYAILGASLKWNFWDWQSGKREKEIIAYQKQIVGSKSEAFELNRQISLNNEKAKIAKSEQAIGMNVKLVDLRKDIAEAASSQLNNGTITATDYLVELQAKVQAELNLELSKITLVQSQVNYLIIRGDL